MGSRSPYYRYQDRLTVWMANHVPVTVLVRILGPQRIEQNKNLKVKV